MAPHLYACVELRAFGFAAALFALSACGSDRSAQLDVTPEDVDESGSFVITDQEYAAFRQPSNGRLTEAQVEQYLKTSLLQFDLVRRSSERFQGRYEEMQKREERGGLMAGLRNLADAGRTMYEFGDLIGGSYVRSARTLGYNPAEMEWVRDQMISVAGYLAARPMYEAAAAGARDMRAQAEELRGQLAESGAAAGFTEADLVGMLETADEMERSAADPDVSPEVLANAEILRRARPAVTEAMWVGIGLSSGASGILALGGMGARDDEELQKSLDEYRRLFTDALENQVTAGMESSD